MSSIIQDISRYQQAIDFALMKAKGQNYIIIKAGGSFSQDNMFPSHYTNAVANGMVVDAYYWDDPTLDAVTQAKLFLATIKGKAIGFLEIDFEQWWSDWDKWQEWRDGIIPQSAVPVATPKAILDSLTAFYNYLKANTSLNIVIYTAAWFVDKYCPEAYGYLVDKYTHWADYSYFNELPIYTSWENLDTLAPRGRAIPSLPSTYKKDYVLLFQWSGDKFTAPGVWADTSRTRLSELDLNLWYSTTISIENFHKGTNDVPLVTKPTFVQSTKPLWDLNVPYVSQLGTGASQYNNDCGAACGAMLVRGYTDNPVTVDQFYAATGQTTDVYLNASQIISALARYDVVANWKISSLATLLADLHNGKPVICLILYSVLVDAGLTQNKTFRGYHFVTAVGYDALNVYIHDPLWLANGGQEIAVPQDTFNKAWTQAGVNPSLNPAFGCIVPEQVLGQPHTSTYTNYKVIASALNVRSSPSSTTSANIVGTVYYGNIIQIESIDSEGWGKFYGAQKYVYMTWLVKV